MSWTNNKDISYAGLIISNGDYGTLELVARYGEVELDDKMVMEGNEQMDDWFKLMD